MIEFVEPWFSHSIEKWRLKVRWNREEGEPIRWKQREELIYQKKRFVRCYTGDSDVGDIVMLVALWWWLILDFGDRIIRLATFFVMLVSSLSIKSVTNILNRSSTSQTFHQHIWSPTSVTNIDIIIYIYAFQYSVICLFNGRMSFEVHCQTAFLEFWLKGHIFKRVLV